LHRDARNAVVFRTDIPESNVSLHIFSAFPRAVRRRVLAALALGVAFNSAGVVIVPRFPPGHTGLNALQDATTVCTLGGNVNNDRNGWLLGGVSYRRTVECILFRVPQNADTCCCAGAGLAGGGTICRATHADSGSAEHGCWRQM
jgi:hypothetical protein